MKQRYVLFFSAFLTFTLSAQSFENTMIFGYGGGSWSPNDNDYGLNILTYSDGNLHLNNNQESDLEFNDTDAAISDENGNLLFYFNGISIYNSAHQVMDNGGTLNDFNQFGYDLPQGGIIIPYPAQPNKYILFHAEEGYIAPWGTANIGVYFSVVDMQPNNGLGRVILRKKPLIIDTLEYGELAVVRHANGRDWWLAIGEAHNNAFYRVLIDKSGPHLIGKQTIGTERIYGLGQAYFSPDGAKYTVFSGVNAGGLTQYADIFDFDRCSGLFSNHEHFEVLSNTSGTGSAISPNSRWLYVSLFDKVIKYDLQTSPIELSRELVAEYEPYLDPFPTNFFYMFPAPDGKIYITTTSGSRTLHVIHRPDEPGTACAFEQHGIRLPCYNARSVPTFANYRLGPVDGSSCDTLGINNVPVSWWRSEQDTLQFAQFAFTDLSYHEPESWLWDFGDGNTSTERHPVHTYASSGTYEVCLSVSNSFGSDTHCKTLFSTVAAKDNPGIQQAIQVGPNPCSDQINVVLNVQLRSPEFHLYDQYGRQVLSAGLALGITPLAMQNLLPGMYFWEIVSAGEQVKGGKVVRM